MNSLIVKLFVFLTEVLSIIIIGVIWLAGIVIVFNGNAGAGLAVAVGGTILVVVIFGFAAIFNEIYKDIRIIRKLAEENAGIVNIKDYIK